MILLALSVDGICLGCDTSHKRVVIIRLCGVQGAGYIGAGCRVRGVGGWVVNGAGARWGLGSYGVLGTVGYGGWVEGGRCEVAM